MIEFAFFIAIAFVVVRTKTWTKGPHLSDYIQLEPLITSAFDEGPLRFKGDEQAHEDPNSNPHYIWYERG